MRANLGFAGIPSKPVDKVENICNDIVKGERA